MHNHTCSLDGDVELELELERVCCSTQRDWSAHMMMMDYFLAIQCTFRAHPSFRRTLGKKERQIYACDVDFVFSSSMNVNVFDDSRFHNVWTLRKGQLNRHTRYRPATTTRNTATQRSRHSVDIAKRSESTSGKGQRVVGGSQRLVTHPAGGDDDSPLHSARLSHAGVE